MPTSSWSARASRVPRRRVRPRRAGLRVLLLERFALGHARGSSHGTSRIFRLNYPDERYVRMAQGALEGWRELEAECGEQLIDRAGVLDLGEVAIENARALAACGVVRGAPGRRGDRDVRRSRLDPDEPALFQPDGGIIAGPTARTRRSWTEPGSAGARSSRTHVDTRDTRAASGSRPRDDSGAAVVVTAGAWAAGLLAGVGDRAAGDADP